MSAGGSTKVIIISLVANFGIAVAKLFGAFFTGSAALMAEAVHSFSDCGNQVLLLYGQKAAKKGPSRKHPLGRGKEAFFWSFVVALLLFSMGGVFSIYEGLHKIHNPEPLSSPWVGVLILLLGIVLEGYSFWACNQEVRRRNPHGSLWQWVQHTTSADLLVIFLEDFAALIGLVLALAALLMAWYTNSPFWDGLGSLGIGVLLIVVAVVLAREVKSLLIGEAPVFDYEEPLQEILKEVIPGARLIRLIALQRGIDEVMLAYKLHPGDTPGDVMEFIEKTNRFEQRVKEHFPHVRWQFAEWDVKD